MHVVKEYSFGLFRTLCDASVLDYRKNVWCFRNQLQLNHLPAYLFATPGIKNHFPQALEILDSYREYKKFASLNLAKKHLIKQIEKMGTCHGECLNILERLIRSPGIKPSKLICEMDKERLAYYQVIEYIRGTCFELQDRCIALMPAKQSEKIVNYKKELKANKAELTKQQIAAFIFRFWDQKKNVGHTMLYVVNRRSFWFYDSSVGLYTYESADKLFKGFYSHLKAFFPNSYHKKTIIQIERYALGNNENLNLKNKENKNDEL